MIDLREMITGGIPEIGSADSVADSQTMEEVLPLMEYILARDNYSQRRRQKELAKKKKKEEKKQNKLDKKNLPPKADSEQTSN